MVVFKRVQGGMVVFKGMEEVMFIDLRTAAAIECYLEEWMAGIQGLRELEWDAAHSYVHMCVLTHNINHALFLKQERDLG